MTIQQAQVQLTAIAQSLGQQHPSRDYAWGVKVVPRTDPL